MHCMVSDLFIFVRTHWSLNWRLLASVFVMQTQHWTLFFIIYTCIVIWDGTQHWILEMSVIFFFFFLLVHKAWSPHWRYLVSFLVCRANSTLNTFLYYKCIVMWDWTHHWRVKMSVLFSLLVCRTLKPALKTFGVMVCCANSTLDTFLFHFCIMMRDCTQHLFSL